jgi:hypothetical protein
MRTVLERRRGILEKRVEFPLFFALFAIFCGYSLLG